MKKETLCWRCQNYAKCSWFNGVPVEGWDAEPTRLEEIRHGKKCVINSFCVNACPLFLADTMREVTVGEVIKLARTSRGTFYSLPPKMQKALLRKNGYKLYIFSLYEEKTRYYVEKL